MRFFASFAVLIFALAGGCEKEKEATEELNAPNAENVIPENFKNTVDEAGYKARLGDVSAVMTDTTATLALGPSEPSRKAKRASLLALALRRLGFSKQIKPFVQQMKNQGMPTGALLIGGDAGDAGDSVLMDDFYVGQDCGTLVRELESTYKDSADSISKSVSEVAAVDWAQYQGIEKVEVDPEKEAFAYTFSYEPDSSEPSEIGTNFDWKMYGGFGGGASEQMVVFRGDANLTLTSTESPDNATFKTNLNTCVDLPKEKLDVGFGLGVIANSVEGGAVSAVLKGRTTLASGEQPSIVQQLEVTMTKNDEKHNGSGEMKYVRWSESEATYSMSATMDGEAFSQVVRMLISEDSFGAESCEVIEVN